MASAASVEVSGSVNDTALTTWELTARQFVDGAWGAVPSLATGTANVSGRLHTWDISPLEGRYRLELTGLDIAGNTAAASAETVFYHAAAFGRSESVGPLTLPSPAGGEGGTPTSSPSPFQGEGQGAGGFVSGIVEVRGTAVAPSLTSYVLEASPDGEIWADVATQAALCGAGIVGAALVRAGSGDRGGRPDLCDRPRICQSDPGLQSPGGLSLQHRGVNILIFSLDGELKATVPLSGIADDAPYDVAVDAGGLIYVTCSVTPAVKVYTRSGELVRTLSPTIENQQSRYRSIDIDEAGNLYVAAPALGKLVKLSPTGEYLQSFGPENLMGASLSPNIGGAQVDRAGNVYLVDGSYGIIYQLDAAGTWIGAVGPFYLPDCFKVDDDGMLYVGMPFGAGFVVLAPSTPVV